MPTSTTTRTTPPSALRTARSPSCTVTERVIQCCSGKVRAAPAKLHHAHSTETGAAGVGPRARVTSAKKT